MTKRFSLQGSAYVEYFVAAALFALASLWFWDGGNFHGLFGDGGAIGQSFTNQVGTITGSPGAPAP